MKRVLPLLLIAAAAFAAPPLVVEKDRITQSSGPGPVTTLLTLNDLRFGSAGFLPQQFRSAVYFPLGDRILFSVNGGGDLAVSIGVFDPATKSVTALAKGTLIGYAWSLSGRRLALETVVSSGLHKIVVFSTDPMTSRPLYESNDLELRRISASVPGWKSEDELLFMVQNDSSVSSFIRLAKFSPEGQAVISVFEVPR